MDSPGLLLVGEWGGTFDVSAPVRRGEEAVPTESRRVASVGRCDGLWDRLSGERCAVRPRPPLGERELDVQSMVTWESLS